jgi:hypothetical protein
LTLETLRSASTLSFLAPFLQRFYLRALSHQPHEKEIPMSANPQQDQHAVRRERIDEAFKIDEPVRDSRVGPRVIPVVIAIVALVVILVLFYVAPWG